MKKFAALLFYGLLLTQCSSDEETTPESPEITDFTPTSGIVGATVTITGAHFSTTPENNTVEFNNVAATVTAATATQLTVTVPATATTGKIEVTTTGGSVTSADDFEVLIDIPRSGLVAFYPFNGNANDASGNNLHGTVSGASPGIDRFGNANKAYTFDGTDDFINMGNPAALQLNNTVTFSCWVNIVAFKTQFIFTKIFFDPNQGGNPAKGYAIYQNAFGNGTPSFSEVIYSSSGLASSYVGETITTGTWIFVTLVIEQSSWKFYQNGVLINDVPGTNLLDDGTLGDLNIGRYSGGFNFDGRIDDVTIYNRALTANEVTQLYQQTITK
jgi:hypothetical protein